MTKPNLFIVGAPKCGTTAMYHYLKQHPDIYFSEKKELHFFGTDLRSPWFIRDIDAYLSMFASAENEKRIGEASVWYLYSKRSAAEIKAFCPSASIIIMLRNPVDMLYSQHSQFLYNGNEDITDFETALEAEEDRKQGLRIPPSVNFVKGLYYLETAKYYEQVRRYIDIFGPDNVHIVIFDQFKCNTAKVYKETLHFLDVSVEFQPNFQVVNPNKRLRNRGLHNFLHKPPQFVRLVGKTLLPHFARQILWKILYHLNVQYSPRPSMDLKLRRHLQAQFASDVEQLGKLIDRDLSNWSEA